MSKALIDTNISHDEFKIGINVVQNCFRMEESIRTKYIELCDLERARLT